MQIFLYRLELCHRFSCQLFLSLLTNFWDKNEAFTRIRICWLMLSQKTLKWSVPIVFYYLKENRISLDTRMCFIFSALFIFYHQIKISGIFDVRIFFGELTCISNVYFFSNFSERKFQSSIFIFFHPINKFPVNNRKYEVFISFFVPSEEVILEVASGHQGANHIWNYLFIRLKIVFYTKFSNRKRNIFSEKYFWLYLM